MKKMGENICEIETTDIKYIFSSRASDSNKGILAMLE